MAANNKASKKQRLQLPDRIPTAPVSRACEEYAYRLIDPDGTDPSAAPSPVPTRGTSVKTKLVQDLKTRYVSAGSGGILYGEINPTLDNTLKMTANVAEAASGAPIATQSYHTISGAYRPMTGGVMSRACSVPSTNGPDGLPAWQLEQNIAIGTATFTATHNSKDHFLNIKMDLLDIAGLVLKTMTLSGVSFGQYASDNVATVSGIVWARISAEKKYNDGSSFDCEINGTLSSNGAIFGFPNVITTTDIVGLDILTDVVDLQNFKLTAMGILGSYQGSDLANGGRCACAKVPRSWTPDESDILASIAKLAYDSYEGTIKEGFHMHWQPSSLDDLVPQDGVRDSNPPLFKYVFALAADDVDQSFRLRLVAHVDYFSTSPAYGSMPYAPDAQGMSIVLGYLARSVPVATSNDTHIRKKLISLVKGGTNKALRYVMANPQVLANLAALI